MPLYTKDEWDAAHEAFHQAFKKSQETIQRLCVDVAMLKPISVSWRKDDPPEPWGCILDPNPATNPTYCDECPVQDDCPYPRKEWSK